MINNENKEDIDKDKDEEIDEEEEQEENEEEDKKEKLKENEHIIQEKNIPKKANNNQFIYEKNKKNIFFVDDDDINDSNIFIKNKNKSIYKNTISVSETEENESSENDTESYESSKSLDINTSSIKQNNNEINVEKDCYLLELNDKGIPNISNDEIITCKKNCLLKIILNNGIAISKDIILITNAENEFPSPFFINSLINEIKSQNEKDSEDDIYHKNLNLNSKYQQYLNNLNEDKSVFKQIKKYQIFPVKINTKIYFQINTKISGNITFIFLYKSTKDNKNFINYTKPFHILVQSKININNKNIEINQIQMQTVYPNYIGTIEQDFEKYYEQISLLNYNFVHFHPLQKLSKDNLGNLYLIKDNNDLNDALFNNNKDTNIKVKDKYQILLNSIKNLKNKYNIGSITDIILSQVSSESDFIFQNKDCTYNLKNTPWLNAAYELDKILMNYSSLFSQKKVSCKSAPYIYKINDIEEIIKEIKDYIIKGKLEEFFMIDENKYINEFKDIYEKLKNEEYKKDFLYKKNILINEIIKNYENKDKRENKENKINKINEIFTNINYIFNLISKCCINYGYERFGVKICPEFISIIILQNYELTNKITDKLPSEINFIKEAKNYINIINQIWIKQINELLKISLLNIKEYLKYKYLSLNPKKRIDQLIESYFIIKDKSNPSEIYLSNGWLMNNSNSNSNQSLNNSLYINTVQYGSWYHLKRKIIIIKDSIKINYGNNIENVPSALINYMSEYISNLAFIFDGLFIDSIRYIPLSVLKYFIYMARKINPDIIFVTNLSSNNNNMDKLIKKKYCDELGINLFMNDMIWKNNSKDVINNIINFGTRDNNIYTETIAHFDNNLYKNSFMGDNKIITWKYKYLKSVKPLTILNDIFDSKTYYEKFKKLSLNISISSLLSLLDVSIGSTYGFDDLYFLLPKLENESRKYELNNKELKDLLFKIDSKQQKPEEDLEVFIEYHPNENQSFNDINKINTIHLALNCYDYNPNIELTKITNNLYMTKISIPPGKYYYQYLINNEIWTYDNTQSMVEDDNGIIYNTIDLRSQNKINIPDLKVYRKELNKIRNFFIDKKSEIYIQKNEDMFGIVRIITENKSLINNNITQNDIEIIKNKLGDESNEDEENINLIEINKNLNSNKLKNLKLTKNELLSKSFEYLNSLESNDIITEKQNFVNSTTKDKNNINEIKNDANNNKADNNNSLLNSTDILETFDGFAVICFPYYESNINKKGSGKIIIPGKIIEFICGCYLKDINININNNINISESILNNTLKGYKGEVSFTKDINYLKSIANIKYINNQTIIEFYNAPQNIGIIIKFKNECNNIINDLNNNLEILFNKGNEFINYFDTCDINKILFGTENNYELKIDLFNNIDDNDKINNKMNKKYKFNYSGINQIFELIKAIKKTENQNLFFNNNTYNISDDNDKIIQSLYKDIYNNDNYIIYLMNKISEAKSFNLVAKFIKKIIYPKYKLLPNFIKPIYFEKILSSLYQIIIKISLGKIPKYLLNFGDFGQILSLIRYQFITKKAKPCFNKELIKLYDNTKKVEGQNILEYNIISGLPLDDIINDNKINTKDLLISFNSLFLIPKLYNEAKIILKLIGSYIKNGLIPDFIDGNNNNYKYNIYEISWLYIRAIKEYMNKSQDYNFLKESIHLLNAPENININYFKIKDKKNKNILSVENIIQLIFQYHAQGINFNNKITKKEKNKKNKNDEFNINILLDISTGFIFKRNEHPFDKNLKIKNNNLGYKADIEIISLLFDSLNFAIKLNNNKYYPYRDVILLNGNKLSFYQWSLLIKKSFDKEFLLKDNSYKNHIIKYINNSKEISNISDNSIILGHKKESSINKKKENESNKLNPNILLAIYYSPDLFSKSTINQSIEFIEKYFLREEIGFLNLDKNPLLKLKGIKAYDIGNNYHEFSWLYGIYLIIKLNSLDNIYENYDDIIRYISKKLYPYIEALKENEYMGIPEIIDEDGNISKDGYETEIKSFAVFYELIDNISKIYEKVNKYKEKEKNDISPN